MRFFLKEFEITFEGESNNTTAFENLTHSPQIEMYLKFGILSNLFRYLHRMILIAFILNNF